MVNWPLRVRAARLPFLYSFVFAAVFGVPCIAVAQANRNWRPDERILITAFHEVGALASDDRALFAATRGGLLQYDFMRSTWALPLTQEDGYPVQEPPTALAIDGLQSDVWLGTATGGLYRYRSVPPRWESVAFALGGEVVSIVPSVGTEEEGIWVQTRTGWFRAGRLAMGATPVPSGRVPASVVQRAAAARTLEPSLAAFRSNIGLDRRARRWPITSFARGERTEQYWFGTNGAFLFRYDALRAQPEWFWFGTPTRGVSAILLLGDTLWFGGDGRGQRSGIARASRDLQSWQLLDPLDGAPGGRIDQIFATEAGIYFAGSDGVWRKPHEDTRAERLSDESANTIAVASDQVWIGSRSGLTRMGSGVTRTTPGAAVSRIRVIGDRVWVAAANGLYHAPHSGHPDSTELLRENGLPSMQILDVTGAGARLFAITRDALFMRDSAGWQGPVRVPAMRGLGRLTALAADGDAVWVGGVNGLARHVPATGEWLYFLAPQDLPAGPVEIVPAGDQVWLATPAGAMRLDWRRR